MTRVVVVAVALVVHLAAVGFAACGPPPDGGDGAGEGEVDVDDEFDVTPRGPGDSPCAGCEQGPGPCDELVERTCGLCPVSPACEAARLLQTYEPGRCAEALTDEQRFPPCRQGACVALMERVCGGAPPSAACASNPGCPLAALLFERATSSSSTAATADEAEASCASALTDGTAFAPCGPG